MQLSLEVRSRRRAPSLRLAEIKSGLGVAGNQHVAWDVFVETFVTVQDMLDGVDQESAARLSDRAPSLPEFLRVQKVRLVAQLEATRLLNAMIDSLYHSLTQCQRTRADRLLPPLCSELGLSNGAPHRAPH